MATKPPYAERLGKYKVVKAVSKVYKSILLFEEGGTYRNNNIVYVSDIITGRKQFGKELVEYAVIKGGNGNIATGFMLMSDLEPVLTDQEQAAKDKEERRQQVSNAYSDASLDDRLLDIMINNSINTMANVDASTKLFGQPFQFSEATDLRVFDSTLEMGRMYTETFIAEAPIVSILPGNSNFLPNMSQEDKDRLLDYWETSGNGAEGKSLDFLREILDQEARYFEFTSDYVSYMQYVNLMCRMSAVYMGLDKHYIQMQGYDKMPFKLFDWKHYRYNKIDVDSLDTYAEDSPFEKVRDVTEQINLENFLSSVKKTLSVENIMGTVSEVAHAVVGERNYVDFYVDPGTSFQETSSNQTAQSQLSSLFETAQSFSKEAHFYRGMADGGLVGDALTGIGNVAGTVGNAVGDLTKPIADALSGGLLTKLFGAANTVIGGGNVMFPEIWGDSNYNKSYSINVNLISPYGTPESVYIHVLVPLFHLLAFSLPRQISSNGFAHPFMVKVTSKGWFSCEMGMVDSISIEKVQGSYTVNGIPTEIKVSLSIRDLYSDLMISPASKPGLFYANRGLGNWLAVTSGLDITQPAYIEKWSSIMWALVGGTMNVTNVFDYVTQSLQNIVRPLVFID